MWNDLGGGGMNYSGQHSICGIYNIAVHNAIALTRGSKNAFLKLTTT